MKFSKSIVAAIVILILIVSMSGCDSSNSNHGSLTLAITDAPVDTASEVVVEFSGVEVKPSGGPALSFDFDEPRQIDLLALQNGNSEVILDNETVTAGDFQWVRLKVNAADGVMDSYIAFEDGSMYSLRIPSGEERGLQIGNGFTVAVGQAANFTIDFDLRKSVTQPMSDQIDYILRPTLRLVDNTQVGTITGVVADSIAEDAACIDGAAVYVYEGENAAVDDLGTENAPLTSANVAFNDVDSEYQFIVAYLLPSTYTLALTCNSANDDPEVDDDLAFIAQLNATVEPEQTTSVAF